jgi:hypothetical protein
VVTSGNFTGLSEGDEDERSARAVNVAELVAIRSADGGVTFTAASTISDMHWHRPTEMRALPLPSAEADAAGTIWVAWHDCRFRGSLCNLSTFPNDPVMTSSPDGLSWAPLRQVPFDLETNSVNHLLPGLGADQNTAGASTTLALVYYFYSNWPCNATTNLCQIHAGFAYSADAGETWAYRELTEVAMSPLWLANTNQGRMVGDYFMTAFTPDGEPHPVYAIGHLPYGADFDEAMYTGGAIQPPTGGLRAASRARETAPARSASPARPTAR